MILEIIRSGKNQEALNELYKSFPAIRSFVLSRGGNQDDARDIFQECLFIFYRNALKPDFVLTSTLTTYLYGICKYLWKEELRKRNRVIPPDLMEVEFNPETNAAEIERENKLQDIIKNLGEKCQRILKLFYYDKMSMTDIAKNLEYGSEDVVKTQKYKCLERARKMAGEGVIINSTNEVI